MFILYLVGAVSLWLMTLLALETLLTVAECYGVYKENKWFELCVYFASGIWIYFPISYLKQRTIPKL